MSGFRLKAGGAIDRTRTISFTFDGKPYTGHPGDTLASALLAGGQTLIGRSFKYHRPRGVMSAGPEEANALVEMRTGARREPNTKATTVELYDGLEASSQNRWPSLRFDVGALTQALGPAAAAGFYYKTFMWPSSFWERIYEPAIRRAAGLGRAAEAEDPDAYEKAFAFCDVLVVGAGRSGLSAALEAARAGSQVILAEEDFVLGGRLLAERGAADEARAAEAELAALPNVRIMRRTAVVGVYDGGTYAALERVADHLPVPPQGVPRQRMWRIVAKDCVIATGAVERPFVFAGNDRPGVMLAGAVRTYLNRFGVSPGRKIAVLMGGCEGWRTVADLVAAGVEVSAVIDTREIVPDETRAPFGDLRIISGGRVTGTEGALALSGVEVASPGGTVKIEADVLAMAGGWSPQIGLTTHLDGRPVWSDAAAAFLPPEVLPKGMRVVGSAAGIARGPVTPVQAEMKGRGKAFVDFQNDVTASDIALGVREGFHANEHLKRYTTLGMATDQGKTSGLNGIAMLAALTGKTIAETGVTRARPPERPVALGALAGLHRGKHLKPTRLTPSHGWAAERGAVFVEAGQWLRAQYYPKPGETEWLRSVTREARSVREAVGVCDVSTLGKISLFGRDVGAFLDHVYANTFSTLPVGKARYGLMLREDGFVMDDGTTARLSDDEWIMTTTTVNAAKVMQHLEFCRQVLWPHLDVRLASVTEQWAQFAVAGPNARALLERVVGDVSDAAVPHLACRAVDFAGVAGRLFRLSYSGERAYEIAVPAQYGDWAVRTLMEAGEGLGVTPYGTEALGVLRIEKGHVAGNELNGQTVARDLGLGGMMSKKKDFIGRVLAGRPALVEAERPSLAGFMPVDRARRIRAGSHFIGVGAAESAANDQGYMTSVCYSPVLGHWIGLGLIRGGVARIGERVRAFDAMQGGDCEVEICAPVFVDPEGTRLHG